MPVKAKWSLGFQSQGVTRHLNTLHQDVVREGSVWNWSFPPHLAGISHSAHTVSMETMWEMWAVTFTWKNEGLPFQWGSIRGAFMETQIFPGVISHQGLTIHGVVTGNHMES